MHVPQRLKAFLDPEQREQFHRRKLAALDNARVVARLDPVPDSGIGKVRMPPEPRGSGFHWLLNAGAKSARRGKVIHDDQGPARPQDPPCLSERSIRTGNDAHHIGRERDVKRRVGKFERSGVHHIEALNLRQPFSIDPRARRAQHRRRDIDARHQHIARQKRQFEPSAHADNEDLAARPCRLSRRACGRRPAGMEGQIEDEVVDRRPAAIGRFRRMPGVGLRRVDRIHCRALPTSARAGRPSP